MSGVPRRSVVLALLVIMSLTLAAGPAAAGTVTRDPAAERYAYRLLNCARTGGLVRADGSCAAFGSGRYSTYRRPLRLHQGISRKVAWPWARTMARVNACQHDIAGRPALGQRLRRQGFRYGYYGENLGCGWGSGDAKGVVLATFRAMQAEQRTHGGHWRNIKDPGYRSVGVGVARGGGRVMVVWDFYGRPF